MSELPMPTGTDDRDRMPISEDLMAADDTVLAAWTLWLRANDLRLRARLARDRAGRNIAPESNIAQAEAAEAISDRLLRLAGIRSEGTAVR